MLNAPLLVDQSVFRAFFVLIATIFGGLIVVAGWPLWIRYVGGGASIIAWVFLSDLVKSFHHQEGGPLAEVVDF